MTKKLSKEAESLILDTIQDMVGYVKEGSTPTEAAIKAASQRKLTRNFVDLVCNGYNIGATNNQRESHTSVLQKYADFPLAESEKVAAALWPAEAKTRAAEKAASSVSSDYSRPPRPCPTSYERTMQEKAASVSLGSRQEEAKPRPKPSRHAMELALKQARLEYVSAQDELLGTIGQLGTYFKQASHEFAFADYAARQVYGDTGRCVMDCLIARDSRRLSRSDSTVKQAAAIDWNAAPYSLIKRAVDLSKSVVRLRDAYRNKQAEVHPPAIKREDLQPELTILGTPKKAGFMAGALTGAASRSLANSLTPAPKSDKVDSFYSKLSDPLHDAELRKIQMQAMLQDLLQNDEVISGYDPDEVLDSYNEMAQLSPSSAIQPALVRPWLRRRLTAGGFEPFEAADMANVEKTIAQTRGPGGANVLSR